MSNSVNRSLMIDSASVERLQREFRATPPPSQFDEHSSAGGSRGSRLVCIHPNNQVRELLTILRDKNTWRNDFIFYADRLIRLVVEEGLNQLPYREMTVLTPAGQQFKGLGFARHICGVSIVHAGEAMEKGLRDCCRSVRIGKIAMEEERTDEDDAGAANPVDELELTSAAPAAADGGNSNSGHADAVDLCFAREPRLVYARFPPDIPERQVFLTFPVLYNENVYILRKALEVLAENGVSDTSIIVLTLFVTPSAVHSLLTRFASLRLVTAEVHRVAPTHFTHSYFGSE